MILDRTGRPIAPQIMDTAPEKAATGMGVTALTYGTPLWSVARSPQRRAYQAAALYRENYLIRLAENPVSQKGGAVPWHLEDDQDNEVEDTAAPAMLAVRDLLERPQAALPLDERQPGMDTFRGLATQTLKHMGLCGTTFWYLDQTEALSGTPLAILYLAPWRLYEVRDSKGRFLTWSLDKPYEDGGELLQRNNVLPFYLNPPDDGVWAAGLVEAAGLKASLDPIIDNHVAKVIGSGGRLAGLISPKQGTVVSEDNWNQFVRDYRNITQDQNAALKLQIVQGAVDYVRTAATLDELAIVEIDERTRDAILGLWGVPRSQVGLPSPAGLNSGKTKDSDEAILWQGAIHPRLHALWETVQYNLLDRYKALGVVLELVLEEPQFDDDSAQFAKAVQAQGIPLTNDERREMIGKEPLDNAALGSEVWLPSLLARVTDASSEPPPPPVVSVLSPEPPKQLAPGPAKANVPETAATKLRHSVDAVQVPKVKRSVLDVLSSQRAAIVAYLEKAGLDHLRRKVDFRWDAKRADREMAQALAPHMEAIASKVARHAHAVVRAGKAADFAELVATRVLTKGAGRIVGINETTRDAVARAIAAALEEADTITDVITAVEALDIFGELRAETIARTESMFAYNDAALGSYREMGVEQVQAIDGDGDPECAERDGQVFSLDEAAAIEDHPNGTLDWVPIVPDEPVAKAEPVPLIPGGLAIIRDPATNQIIQLAPVLDPAAKAAPPSTWRLERDPETGAISGMVSDLSMTTVGREDLAGALERFSKASADQFLAALQDMTGMLARYMERPVQVTIPPIEIPAAVVNVPPTTVNVPAPVVHVAPPPAGPSIVTKTVERDHAGNITRVIEHHG